MPNIPNVKNEKVTPRCFDCKWGKPYHFKPHSTWAESKEGVTCCYDPLTVDKKENDFCHHFASK